jgi:hypothetical protein
MAPMNIPTMDWHSNDVPAAFKLFYQRLELYFIVNKVKDDTKVAIFLLAVGEEGLKRYNSWTLTDAERKDCEIVCKKFLEQLEPTENYRISRLKLSKLCQKPEETLDEFVNRCQTQAKTCAFSDDEHRERIIELIIASTPIPELQKELLTKEKGFTIQEAVKLGRTYEASAAHIQTLQSLHPSVTHQVAALQKSKPKSRCHNCGLDHRRGKEHCPAKDDVCSACKKIGHWAKMCITSKYQKGRTGAKQHYQPHQQRNQQKGEYRHSQRKQQQVHSIETEVDETANDIADIHFDVVEISPLCMDTINRRNEAHISIHIKPADLPPCHLKLKVDTGAQANTLPYRTYKQMYPDRIDEDGKPLHQHLAPPDATLAAYNGSHIECAGTINIPCQYRDSQWIDAKFFVVNVPGPAVLGLPSCEDLQVVTLHCAVGSPKQINTTEDLVTAYPNQFDSIGEFRTVHKLTIDPNVPPRIDPPRRIPIALKDKIKSELDKMVEQDVIRRIEEPTDWVSSLTYVTKRDGSLRVCLDPRHLNKALLRPHHQTPTTEELNHRFANAKFFSKLDAKAGYWSIKLDEPSQKLTTFQTPYGRFCFKRLPFGLSVSQDLFQLEMDRIIEKCPGACGIADDVVVFGATEDEHDRNLIQFMQTAQTHGLKLNSAKCEVKKKEITFFGNIYSDTGMKPDPQKVRDLQAMPAPSSRAEVQQFLGFITYLSRYIKDFSSKTAVIRGLLSKEAEFIWEPHHQRIFDQLKEEVSEQSLLHYYNPLKEVHMHCDASIQGVGAALLQPDDNGVFHPVAYASKSLTPTEQRYACIERELLSIVFGTRRFHTYLFGRSFQVITDHRPLVMIVDKPLTSAPPRLQRMLVELQGYNFVLTHRPGTQNQLADGLSRLPSPNNKSNIDLDLRVDHIDFSTSMIGKIRSSIEQDPVLQQLQETIITGWPEHIKDLPTDLRTYWGLRDSLSIENGVIYKGQQLLIPKPQQNNILEQLHTAHMGQEKTKLLAKVTVYWPNINHDIEELIKRCQICQRYQPAQCPEPLLQHSIPTKPWSVLAADLFHFEESQWIIIADYFSKYPVVKKLPSPCPSATIVQIMKEVFAEMGIPDKLVSDNGPHFASASFQAFAAAWGFQHTTTSPNRPQGNGFIERQIRTVKQLFKKGRDTKTDLNLTLLMWRSTPVSANVDSPARLLLGRQPKSTLPSTNNADNSDVVEQLNKRQASQKVYFDRHALKQELPPLFPGQQVMVLNTSTRCWEPSTVDTRTEDPRAYIVRGVNGAKLRRNRQHIREAPQLPNAATRALPPSPVATPPATPPSVPPSPSITTTVPGDKTRDFRTRSGRVVQQPVRYRKD